MQLPTPQHLCLPPPPLPLHCSNREQTPSPPPPLTTSTTNPLHCPNSPPPPLPTLPHLNREWRGFACHKATTSPSLPPQSLEMRAEEVSCIFLYINIYF